MKNTTRIKQFAKLILPPLFLRSAKYVHARFLSKPEWEYAPYGWETETLDANIKGWNVQSILDAYIAKWPEFVESLEGTHPLGLSAEGEAGQTGNLIFHNILMAYAYTLSLAAHQRSRMSMLDWGGGIGHYYLIGKILLSDVEIEYHCKDLPILASHGQKLFPEANFYSDEECLSRQYDYVLASSSLQYSRNWQKDFSRLAACSSGYLYVTRLPVVHHVPSYVMVQRPYQHGYGTEYLGWCINRQEILTHAQNNGLTLVREFISEYPPFIHGAPEQCDYWGFLFRPSKRRD